ncbi:hypothetical protein SAMN06297251_103114 [Fulvimarina manganoxydans]|uniref:Phage DNA packaging protein, Nu1 subunit of terminase n=1 Tax=Fulvimarina manganoxydans TaxID=937218 RepID=A0A1W1ZT25_9HYPH|nr:hypothetical protein [Fulvimarina manganoxydans]SMC51625.1 hypothetical protein SAMN06297251_103114 [Fulvimarina manganoxydans]
MTKPKAKIPAEVPAAEMARFLQISVRQLQALSRRGTLPKTSRDSYPMKATADAFYNHQLAEIRRRAGSTSADALREQRAAEIAARMRKEDREIIMLDEAIETFDDIRDAMSDTIDRLDERIPKGGAKIGEAKAEFEERAARLRLRLETGQAEPDTFDDGEEDR